MTSPTNEQLTNWKQLTVEGQHRPFAVGRCGGLVEQFELIRPEFGGKSQLCFELAKTIVLIRREIDLSENVERFFAILFFDFQNTCDSLSTRWLVSVLDTIADHGNPQQRIAATSISSFVNLVKLAETEHLLRADTPDSSANYVAAWPHDLGHGMTSYNLHDGDMPRNLFERIEKSLESTPALRAIFQKILGRMKTSENMLSRLARYNSKFWAG